jgi:hypothetical protein
MEMELIKGIRDDYWHKAAEIAFCLGKKAATRQQKAAARGRSLLCRWKSFLYPYLEWTLEARS